MELKEFIAQTLIQIIQGVHTAQSQVPEYGGKVNPYFWSLHKEADFIGMTGESGGREQPVTSVNFDVAIMTGDSSESKGGLGIFVGGFGVGAQNQTTESNAQQNRIRFSVPVLLPQQKAKVQQSV
jgi:hypothetical protein